MNKRFQLAALTISLALSSGAYAQSYATSAPGQGTWETTLQGRDLDGDLTNGYEAFYDTALNVTWLNQAPLPWSSNVNARTNRDWVEVNNYAKQLNVFGITGWRLPAVTGPYYGLPGTETRQNIEPADIQYWQGDSFRTDRVTFQSELEHLYYVTLGNYGNKNGVYGYGSVYGRSGVRAGWQNSGPFGYFDPYQGINKLELPTILWLGAPRGPKPDGETLSVVVFRTDSGGDDALSPDQTAGALFVRSGDVGVAANVPEPQTYALTLAGLMVAASAARRRKT